MLLLRWLGPVLTTTLSPRLLSALLSAAAKMIEKQEQAVIAQNAKSLSDQLFEIDDQQHQQRTGNGKGVASTFAHTGGNLKGGSNSPKVVQHRQINQPGGAQACNKH